MTDLSQISTRALAEALGKRQDIEAACVRPDGMVDPAIWPIRTALGAIPCVDGIAIRLGKDNLVEGGVIRRKTGKFPNKLAYIGGVVGKYETREAALRRHFKTDLGVEIDILNGLMAVELAQYAPQVDSANRDGFRHDPGKHSHAETFLVLLRSDSVAFGSTDYGAQEAMGFEWYSAATCPNEGDWSYDMRPGFLHVLGVAESMRQLGGL